MHVHQVERVEWRAWMAAGCIQVTIVIIEALAVPRTGSQALLSDLLHNSSDILLLTLSAIPAVLVAMNSPSHRFIHRWRKATAGINLVALTMAGSYAVWRGWHVLPLSDRAVDYQAAWPVALISFGGNLLTYGVIRPHGHHAAARVFGWHQLWDVVASFMAAVILFSGARVQLPQLDAQAGIAIGAAMVLHWPVAALLERNGHRHDA